MSRKTDDDDERALQEVALRALRAGDELVPTSEAEVERAEGMLQRDSALPDDLRTYRTRRPRHGQAPNPPRRQLGVTGYAVATVVGALAAGTAVHWLEPQLPTSVTSAGSELVKQSASAKPRATPLSFQSNCEKSCCAGSACPSAAEGLRACPSGIRCASCAADNVNGGPYRLRLGSVIVTEQGQKLLPLSAPLELCVTGGAAGAVCVPALGEPGSDSWRLLPQVTPLQDLLTGPRVELRKRGDSTVLASWKHVVSPTAELLCRGLAVVLNNEGETLGRLSVFIEPTHFVELSRAATVPSLLEMLTHYEIAGTEPRVYESSQAGARRFALVLGPFDKAEAEALRWQALDHGAEANVSLGLDFIGNPRPAR
ncbi:MAG TPA: hypothetical protein VHB79_30390 [Polyangiaceae bacterium]|nr:hypothetical protein [Polyangiaceae bacterium]